MTTTNNKDDFHSGTSNTINYKHLEDTRIRLLTILPSLTDEEQVQCSLESFAIDDLPPYIALSYTWNLDHKETRKIIVNGQTFEATKNLGDALKHLQTEKSSYFWADAICINQRDDDEKKHQLRLMPTIFSRAQETRVWLGSQENNSDRAMNLINKMSNIITDSDQNYHTGSSGPAKVSVPGDETDIIALQHLLARRYWYRVWVVQEIAMSKEIIISCGECQLPWNSVLNATNFMIPYTEIEAIIHNYYKHPVLAMVRSQNKPKNTLRDGMQRILSIQSVRNDKLEPGDPVERPPDSLLYLLSSHRPTEATEARDKYYALAGLVLEENSILSRTSAAESVEGIYILAAESTTKERGHSPLDFLDFAGWPTKLASLPSWVPDWSYTRDRAVPLLYWQLAGHRDSNIALLNAPGPFNASDPETFSFSKEKCLLARGFEIDTINGVGFSRWWPNTEYPSGAEVQNPTKSPQHGNQIYSFGGEELTDVIWKTFVLNFTHAGVEAPAIWGRLFYQYIFCFGGLNHDLDLWYEHNKDFKVYGVQLKKLAQDRREPNTDLQVDRETISQLKNAFDIAVRYRRLATTEDGYICLAPSTAQCGDLVVVLLNCSVPVILRPKHKCFKFIGTCYVHGIMQGEAMVGLSSQNSIEFEIR